MRHFLNKSLRTVSNGKIHLGNGVNGLKGRHLAVFSSKGYDEKYFLKSIKLYLRKNNLLSSLFKLNSMKE